MSSMFWDAVTAIASTVSMVAFVLTAIYIRDQLKGQQQDRYLNITSDLFGIWQSRDFMEMQLWLIHRMEETAWRDFVAKHRCDYGEVAFHRVGSFYDRVGTLVRLGFVNDREILETVGGYAIAVWNKIEPLVREARRIENSDLFHDFERLLPVCRECYVPTLSRDAAVKPFSIHQPEPTISLAEVKQKLDGHEPLTLLDVRHPTQVREDPRRLPRAIHIPADQVDGRENELDVHRLIAVYCA
jgi:hypothetical protein